MGQGPVVGGHDGAQGDEAAADRVTPLLEARAVTKAFGDLIANDHIDLVVMPGDIHALLGENGAGKSTLVKMIYGVLRPTSGDFFWRGAPVDIAGPAHARALGIGMVFQHFSLFEALTVTENIALALPPGTPLWRLADRVRDVSQDYGLPLSPHRAVHMLSAGERQRIEIVRCLLQNPRLLIMDEPTSVLAPQEAERLFETLERLSAEGCAILYISHKLGEVKRLCRTATVLRLGRKVATCDPRKETAASLARMMVGGDVGKVRATAHQPGPVRLSVKDLSQPARDIFGVTLQDISLDVRGGEIVGIVGIAGNGQDELFALLSGEDAAPAKGSIAIDGKPMAGWTINRRRRLNAAFIPEERIGHGAVQHLTLSQNVILSLNALRNFVRGGYVDQAAAAAYAEGVVSRFDVRVSHADPQAGALSGGNLQKFVVGREMLRDPGVLIVNQPTWGVDAGAAATIRQALIDLAARGAAVLVISQDLDEIFEIADRIAVISAGRLSQPYERGGVSVETIGLLMGGVEDRTAREAAGHAS